MNDEAYKLMSVALTAVDDAIGTLKNSFTDELPFAANLVAKIEKRHVDLACAFAHQVVKFYSLHFPNRFESAAFAMTYDKERPINLPRMKKSSYSETHEVMRVAGMTTEDVNRFDRAMIASPMLREGFRVWTRGKKGGVRIHAADVDLTEPFPDWFITILGSSQMKNLPIVHNAYLSVAQATAVARPKGHRP